LSQGLKLKTLIVYYSRTGNARFVAETMATEMGADVEEIIDQRKRSGILGFLRGGSDARNGKETEIAPTKKAPADYDLIIVGSPIWASRPTPAITTYLKKNNLTGKKVAVFFTQGGKKPVGIDQTKALMPNSNCIGVLSISNPLNKKEESGKQIKEWCKTLAAN
jgi:flavodoxin